MKLLTFSLLLLTLLACSTTPDVVPTTAKIKAKFLVLDEKLSPQIIKCSEDIPNFLNMKADDCSFKLGNSEFDIEEKYLLDKKGAISEYWVYHSEGPERFSLSKIKQDSTLSTALLNDKQGISFTKNKKAIVDSKDTFEIEKVFLEEKMLVVKSNKNIPIRSRKFIYQFQ
jgi:hypothetical protein